MEYELGKYEDLTRTAWIGLPLAALVLPFVVLYWNPDSFLMQMTAENSLIENATAFMLAIAAAHAIAATRYAMRMPFPLLKILMPLYLAGCVYFLGEEISWGQHFIGWGIRLKMRVRSILYSFQVGIDGVNSW